MGSGQQTIIFRSVGTRKMQKKKVGWPVAKDNEGGPQKLDTDTKRTRTKNKNHTNKKHKKKKKTKKRLISGVT